MAVLKKVGRAPDHHYTSRCPRGHSYQVHPHEGTWKVVKTIQEEGCPKYWLAADLTEARGMIDKSIGAAR